MGSSSKGSSKELCWEVAEKAVSHSQKMAPRPDRLSLPLGIMAVRTCYSHFVSKIIRGNHWELNHWIQLGLKASLPLDFQWNELMLPLTTWARTKDFSCEWILPNWYNGQLLFFFFFYQANIISYSPTNRTLVFPLEITPYPLSGPTVYVWLTRSPL